MFSCSKREAIDRGFAAKLRIDIHVGSARNRFDDHPALFVRRFLPYEAPCTADHYDESTYQRGASAIMYLSSDVTSSVFPHSTGEIRIRPGAENCQIACPVADWRAYKVLSNEPT